MGETSLSEDVVTDYKTNGRRALSRFLPIRQSGQEWPARWDTACACAVEHWDR